MVIYLARGHSLRTEILQAGWCSHEHDRQHQVHTKDYADGECISMQWVTRGCYSIHVRIIQYAISQHHLRNPPCCLLPCGAHRTVHREYEDNSVISKWQPRECRSCPSPVTDVSSVRVISVIRHTQTRQKSLCML